MGINGRRIFTAKTLSDAPQPDYRSRFALGANVGASEYGCFSVLNHIADAPGVLVFNAPKAANKNFAPKVGIAYSPGTSGNTSIRAGFGMAYDVIFDNVGSTAYPPQISATIDAGDHPRSIRPVSG